MNDGLLFIAISDIAIIFGLSAVSLYVCHLLRIPAVLGFLFAGMVSGPAGFGLIDSADAVSVLAEFGVIFLLFTIGVEFSFKQLFEQKQVLFIGGSLQVGLTVGVVTGTALLAGLKPEQSVALGFLASVSSTAIVMKVLQERGETDAPHGRITLAISLFNDLASIPMMLAIPFLSGSDLLDSGGNWWVSILKGAGLVGATILAAKFVIPWLLRLIVGTRNMELFLLSIVVICFATAWITASIGLSLALGAFLAGLIVSESEFSRHALFNVLPFRDTFISFFFVSVGMLFDVRTILNHPLEVIALAAGALLIKTVIAAVAALAFRQPLKTALLTGLGLSQIGEFSFILAGAAFGSSLLSPGEYQMFLAVAILTIAATPFLFKASPWLTRLISGPVSSLRERFASTGSQTGLRDHLIILGYGVNGMNLARTAKRYAIPYVILEMNNATVRRYREEGEPIVFGDGTQSAVLQGLGVESARVLVAAVSDAAATRRIVEQARSLSPELHIIARTRFIAEVEPLLGIGADDVIPEEFETAIEIFSRVLTIYRIGNGEIRRAARQIRSDHYSLFRQTETDDLVTALDIVESIGVETVLLSEGSLLAGRTLEQSALRREFGVSVLAVNRNGDLISNPSADFAFKVNDLVVLLGNTDQIARAIDVIQQSSIDT